MDKIFYYRHTNNEIYELKFTKVIIELGGLVHWVEKGMFNVHYVEVEVAGLGTLYWAKYNVIPNTLRVAEIYDTIEKAIRGYNVNTLTYDNIVKEGLRSEDLFKVDWHRPWDCSKFNLNFNLPNHIFEVGSHNFAGAPTIVYHTWVWDGLKAIEKGSVGMLKPHKYVTNSCKYLMYDLVSGECFYDKDIVGYVTREDCANANCVKIHRF